jgi:uncharacterized sulfatase
MATPRLPLAAAPLALAAALAALLGHSSVTSRALAAERPNIQVCPTCSTRDSSDEAGTHPNILWLTAEDMSPNLGAYGDLYAVTPHIDRLAREGVRYLNAFAPIGVCAPARSSLITGMYAPAIGSHHMRSKAILPEGFKLYPEHLREAGYYATNNSKEDYNLRRPPPGTWDESSTRAHWRNRKEGQPFFAIFNFTSTHESQIRLAEDAYRRRVKDFAPGELHDPARAPLPPYHPDTAEVRRDWARYADMITYMDREVGKTLAELEEDGLAEETIVFFYSDHGAGMPRSKRWLYDSSLRVPLIVRFPEKYRHLAPGKPGSTTDRLVTFVDLGPTALSLAGVKVPPHMHGRPFLGAEETEPRRYVHGFRDRMDERYDLLRAVRDERYKYIRNYLPHLPYAQHVSYMYEMPAMKAWARLHGEGKLVGAERYFFAPKAAEELYDTRADPHEVHNLAGSADHRAILERLAAELDRWIAEIGDLGFLPEPEIYSRAGGSAPYALARDPARYPLARIEAAARLASRGDRAALPALVELLADEDSAVRYWGAVGLRALGEDGRDAIGSLRAALEDSSPSVRLAAADALWRLGRDAEALPVLGAGLEDESEHVRLHAAIVLDEMDGKARPLLEAMEEARAAKDGYPARVLQKAIADLGG